MPIYEYQCQACGAVHEALQKVSDPVLRKCPECGALKLKKLVSAPSFRLSGTGWYETDFKSDKDKQRNLAVGDSQKEDSKQNQKDDQKGDQASDKKKTDSSDKKSADSKAKPDSKSDKKQSVKKSTSDKAKPKTRDAK